MKAIVNATPLIALAVIDRLDLLRLLFDDVIVPQEVYDEVVVQGAGQPGAEALARADWLQIQASSPVPTLDPLLTGLDAGEIAVLLLARQISPDWVIIDERQARRAAFALELPVKGTLGILLASKARSVIAVDTPSKAVRLRRAAQSSRSAEVLPLLRQYFDIVEYKPLGGTILQFLLADIAGNFQCDETGARLLKMLFAIEDALLDAGHLRSDFAYIVAAPRRQTA